MFSLRFYKHRKIVAFRLSVPLPRRWWGKKKSRNHNPTLTHWQNPKISEASFDEDDLKFKMRIPDDQLPLVGVDPVVSAQTPSEEKVEPASGSIQIKKDKKLTRRQRQRKNRKRRRK